MSAASEDTTIAPLELSQKEPLKEALQKAKPKRGILHVYQHSNFFSWWVVWAYGFFCALLTYFNGRTVNLFADKQPYVHSSGWIGISFIALLLIVTVFTIYRVLLLAKIAGTLIGAHQQTVSFNDHIRN